MKLKSIIICITFSFNTFGACDLHWSSAPKRLTKTCLFENIQRDLINPKLDFFTPRYPLFTDGMDKRRWVYIPPNTQIDNGDEDNWEYPVGTIIWKEFSHNGLKLETRVLKKIKQGRNYKNWSFATYKWNMQQTEAHHIITGEDNIHGTIHQIPSVRGCMPCHRGSMDAILGFSAIQLSHKPKMINQTYLQQLITNNKLTHPNLGQYNIDSRNEFEEKALGYLHGNCAHCHNDFHPMGNRVAMKLKQNTILPSETITTTVNQLTRFFTQVDFRIKPREPKKSAIWVRINSTRSGIRMAPIGRKTIDPIGKKAIEDWINSL